MTLKDKEKEAPPAPNNGGAGRDKAGFSPAPPLLGAGGAVPAARGRSLRSAALANRRAALALFLLACAGAALTLVPFYLMLVMSLKTSSEIAENPWALPHVPQWFNYVRTWTIEGTDVTFAHFFRNTLVIAILGTLGT